MLFYLGYSYGCVSKERVDATRSMKDKVEQGIDLLKWVSLSFGTLYMLIVYL